MRDRDPLDSLTPFDLPESSRAQLAKLLREGWNDAEIMRVASAGNLRLRKRENRTRRWVSYTAYGVPADMAEWVFVFCIHFAPPTCTPTRAGFYLLSKTGL